MSARLIARVFEHSRATGTDLLVLVALAHFCNAKRDDNTAWPSLAVLAKRVKLSVSGLCKSLTRLEAIGDIKRDRSSGGRNQRSRYLICLGNSELQDTVSIIENCESADTVSNSVSGHNLNSETVSYRKRFPTGNGFLQGNETVSPSSHAINKKRTYTHSSAPDSENQRESAAAGDDAFERAWRIYPKRGGGNSKKEALRAWRARVRAGADAAQLISGVERYARYVHAAGKEGTQYVKQAATFFGPDEHWKEAWEIPPPSNSGRSVGGFAA